MQVVSVQIGHNEELTVGDAKQPTGIFKRPVNSIELTADCVVGDTIANLEHHGGADQAVYVYSVEDYEYFAEAENLSWKPGDFGENITISGLGDRTVDVRVGDRFTIGEDAVLEATAPRVPCAKFTARMGRPGWLQTFKEANRTGFYARVISPGEVFPGDSVVVTPAPATNVTITAVLDLYYNPSAAPTELEAALDSPIAARARNNYQSRLGRRRSTS